MKTVVFDFDGVIHSYRSGWQGETIIPDPPVDGIAEAISNIRAAGYEVIVVSTRCAVPCGRIAVARWLEANGIKVDGVQETKPPAIAYIDDRAICFDGNAQTLLTKIELRSVESCGGEARDFRRDESEKGLHSEATRRRARREADHDLHVGDGDEFAND